MADHCERCGKKPDGYLIFSLGVSFTSKDRTVFTVCDKCKEAVLREVMEND